MLFNTPIFFVFFCVYLFFYGFIFMQRRPRVFFTLVASLVFYGAWNYRFIPLLVGSAVIDYFLAQAIGNAQTQARKVPRLVRRRRSAGTDASTPCPAFASDSSPRLAAM